MPLQTHRSRGEPPCGSASWADRSRDLRHQPTSELTKMRHSVCLYQLKVIISTIMHVVNWTAQAHDMHISCFLIPIRPLAWSSNSLPEPDLIRACALLKKKMAKSMRAPLAVCPSTRMCFSGRCQPLGRTISVACCMHSPSSV